MKPNEIIKFIRRHDYQFIKELGQGACGRTVLLYDDQIDRYFVCKKFTPYSEIKRQELFINFIQETKILHQVYHKNVVRVFNYYLYPESHTGFILMEFVEGTDIEDYLTDSPEMVNEIFLQVIDGFHHLEINNILHRDIRPQNLLIHNDGTAKIIDFGFGKNIHVPEDFDKSVSLNWWCEKPNDFSHNVYNFKTEVYFVGKLFERIIQQNQIDQFKYMKLLSNMCKPNPIFRTEGFAEIVKEIQSDIFYEIGFNEDEMHCYRNFANSLEKSITKIENDSKYQENIDKIQNWLENAYRSFMLEETVPDSSVVIRCIIKGSYYYKKKGLYVSTVKNFVHLLKSSPFEKKRIILSNLNTRLDSIPRYIESVDASDLPF